MSSPFLAAAYAFIWVVFILYAWNLNRRKARLQKELEALRKQVRELPTSEPSSG